MRRKHLANPLPTGRRPLSHRNTSQKRAGNPPPPQIHPSVKISIGIVPPAPGRKDQKEFAEDVLNALRNEDLNDVPDPEPYSWENLIKEQVEYFKEVLGD